MHKTYIQESKYSIVISPITGNAIIRNDSDDQYLLSPKFDAKRAAFICARVQGEWGDREFWRRIESTPYESAFLALAAGRRKSSFIAAFNGLIQTISDGIERDKVLMVRVGIRRRFAEVVIALWEENLLASPPNLVFGTHSFPAFQPHNAIPRCGWIAEVQEASTSKTENGRRRAAFFAWRLAMTSLDICEIGDLTPDTVRKEMLRFDDGVAPSTIRPILIIQKRIYAEKAIFTEYHWGTGRGRPKADLTFANAIDQDLGLAEWQKLFLTWLSNSVTGGVASKRDAGTAFLRYLAETATVTRAPIEYVSRRYTIPLRFEEWIDGLGFDDTTISKRIGQVAGFFDWYVDVQLCMEDDLGRPVRNPELFNPIVRRKEGVKRAETARDALPLRYIHELISILTEEDFAWPRSLPEDYIKHFCQDTNKWTHVWCPVRAYAMLVKLYLPLRTYQVLMLDSGEADSEIFEGGRWVKNDGALAPGQKTAVRKGFLRRFRDLNAGSDFTGFYVNTNKTADRVKSNSDRGYEIPWTYDQVIDIAVDMAAWQRKYNPIHKPTRWADLTNPSVKRAYTPAQLIARGENSFLFRDPIKSMKDQPMHSGRLAYFWRRLLDKLEERVAGRGEVLPNGEPIRFIRTRNTDGSPLVPAFDLHSLRVSILTALSVDGGVPLSILSKCVAGHATVLMTLYYLKQGPSYISQQLAEAQARMLDKEKENYFRFLQDCEIAQAESVVAFNDRAGLMAVQDRNVSGWIVGDLGICPVGGSMCAVGGPKVSGENGRNDFQPTPGGPRNCVRCRFFLSGPAFLGGLVSHFNSVGLEIMDASARLRDMDEAIIQLEDSLAENAERPPSDRQKLDALYGRREFALSSLDDVAANWHATYGLIERSKAILAVTDLSSEPSTKVKLLATGDLMDITTALGQVTEFELINSICQHATVYPATTVPTASLRRGRLLDAMLARNERLPVFASLSDAQALAVGNELVNFLFARIGRTETIRVMDGTNMLRSAGLSTDMDDLLASQVGHSIRMADIIGDGANRPVRQDAPMKIVDARGRK